MSIYKGRGFYSGRLNALSVQNIQNADRAVIYFNLDLDPQNPQAVRVEVLKGERFSYLMDRYSIKHYRNQDDAIRALKRINPNIQVSFVDLGKIAPLKKDI